MVIRVSRRAFVSSILGTCLGVAFIFKDKFAGKKYTYQTDAARRKVIIITGASSGIGKATAKDFVFRRANVVLACRERKECEKTKLFISLYHKVNRVECIECDLSSQRSIRNFVAKFNEKYKRLDVLINNAGVFGVRRTLTREGIELHLGVNHMGHFLLTNLLLPKLKESAPSRIVNVTSLDYKNAALDKDNMNMAKDYNAEEAYKRSKLANVLFTMELAERLKGTGVTVNAVYPGVVNTNLMRHTTFHKSWITWIFLKPILWVFIKNPHQGAQPIVYAAIDPDLNETSGYLIETNFVKNSLDTLLPNARKEAQWLWAVSEKWTDPSIMK